MVLVCFHCCRYSVVYGVLLAEWQVLAIRVIIINVRAVFFHNRGLCRAIFTRYKPSTPSPRQKS